jgi:hypothetical protein
LIKKQNLFHAGLACALYDYHRRNKFFTIESIPSIIFNAVNLDDQVAMDIAVARALRLRGAKNAVFNMKIGLSVDLKCSDEKILVSPPQISPIICRGPLFVGLQGNK